jgi:hypothetical protein
MTAIALITLPLALAWALQAPPAPTGQSALTPEQEQAKRIAEMPWFARLGMRSLGIEGKLPVVDRVVLVANEGAYLAEIARWTPKARWPVLIEDDEFAPRFIRAFKPAQVIRRPASAAPADDAALRAAVDAAIAHAWGGDPANGSVAALRAIGLVPAGIVGASVKDPAWTAAVALAAGRGQPLVWIEEPAGSSSNDILGATDFAALDAAVRNSFASSGLTWNTLGDDLETFTLCRHAALRVDLPSPAGGRNPQLPKETGPLSLTDALCRNDDGSRWGFAAQIFGTSTRSAYMAMCSLFLHRTETWMFDGYANRTGGMYAAYSFAQATPVLAQEGFTMKSWEGSNGTLTSWRSLLPKGIGPDVLFMNSSGNADFFEVETSSNAPSTDIPVLRKPMALSMIHSFSLQAPDAAYTVGGRWLDHGVYAYVGSVHEPYLTAFVPPATLIQRLAALTPFLVAGRQWPGDPIAQVWRIATIGDPLMTMPAPKTLAMLPGRDHAPALVAGEMDLRDSARAALERLKDADPAVTRESCARAMRDLVLAGDDTVAAQLWKLAKAKGAQDAVARIALGPIFRAGTRAEFMEAWSIARDPTDEQRDMLWHLWALDIPTLRDPVTLTALKSAMRAPRLDMDAQALLPAVRAVDGRIAADTWVNELISKTPDVEARRKLAQLLAPN